MSYLAGLLGQVNTRRKEDYEQSRAEEAKLADMEMAMLMQLAQGDDDELAALAGTGLLERISGGSKIGRAKGLQGFLGEAQRSSYLPMVKNMLTLRGAGAQPNSSPTERGSAPMAAAPAVAPRAPEMSMESRGGLGLPPGLPEPVDEDAALNQAMGVGGGAEASGMAAGAAPLGQGSTLPPPPELPQQKFARLYPSAAESAANAARAEVRAKYEEQLAMLQRAKASGDPDIFRGAMGMVGAPMPFGKPQPVWVRYIGPDGKETTNAGTIDPQDGRVYVDGIAVTPLQQPQVISATRGGSGYRVNNVVGPDGQPQTQMYDANNQLIGAVPTVPQAVPQEFGPAATIMVDGKPTVVQQPRTGDQAPRVLGPAPPRATGGSNNPAKTPAALEAAAMLKDVEERLKAKLGETGRMNFVTGKARPLSPDERDTMVKQATGGRYVTYQSLVLASKGGAVGPPPAPPPPSVAPSAAFGTPAGADAIRMMIQKRQQSRQQ